MDSIFLNSIAIEKESSRPVERRGSGASNLPNLLVRGNSATVPVSKQTAV